MAIHLISEKVSAACATEYCNGILQWNVAAECKPLAQAQDGRLKPRLGGRPPSPAAGFVLVAIDAVRRVVHMRQPHLGEGARVRANQQHSTWIRFSSRMLKYHFLKHHFKG